MSSDTGLNRLLPVNTVNTGQYRSILVNIGKYWSISVNTGEYRANQISLLKNHAN